jgi:hypothetical protein
MMNDSVTNQHDLAPEDERLLDLLVDGELDDARRRKLLLTFEEKPSGWRRCALAFLEAQSWGSSFKSLLQERPAAANTSVEQPVLAMAAADKANAEQQATSAKRFWQTNPLSGLAMAASMLVAFALGLALHSAYAPSDESPRGLLSSDGGAADRLSSPPFAFAPTVRNTPDAASENVRLVVDGDGVQRTVDVPLLDDPTLVNSFPFRNESAIPAEVLQQLEQMGHRVEHQRRLAPVELADGRWLYVPVEDVKIVPVRRQPY